MIGNKICIQNIQNNSTSSTKDVSACYGILYTGCKNINVDDYSIYNVNSKKGLSADLMYKNENTSIIHEWLENLENKCKNLLDEKKEFGL